MWPVNHHRFYCSLLKWGELFFNAVEEESAEFKRFRDLMSTCNSGDPGIKDYLEPQNGLRYLDIGSCLNLMEYDLYQWPSNYYGIDISQKLIRVAKSFINTNRIKIGGLLVAEISNLPFDNNYFDIASAIGVLEYYELAYITQALKELNRILKRKGKLVIDMPNERHPDLDFHPVGLRDLDVRSNTCSQTAFCSP